MNPTDRKYLIKLIRNISLVLVLMVLVVLSSKEGKALTWNESATIDTGTVYTKFTTNVWGTNFDTGFGQWSTCKGNDMYGDSQVIAKNRAMGLQYVRTWITRQADFVTAGTDPYTTDFTKSDQLIGDVIANGAIPIVTFRHCYSSFGKVQTCWWNNATDTDYDELPDPGNFSKYVKVFIDHYNASYDLTQWRFSLLNEPLVFDADYAKWFNVVYANLTAYDSTLKFGANPVNTTAFINALNTSPDFLEWHGYGEGGDPTLDDNDKIMNNSWKDSTYLSRGKDCQEKLRAHIPAIADSECWIGEYNWHSSLNFTYNDPRQYTNFVTAWTASVITTFLNATSSGAQAYNKTFLYEGADCANYTSGEGMWYNNSGTITGKGGTQKQNEPYEMIHNYSLYGGNIYNYTMTTSKTNLNNQNLTLMAFESNKTKTGHQYFLMIVNRKNATGALNLTLERYTPRIYEIKSNTNISRSALGTYDITLDPYEVAYFLFNDNVDYHGLLFGNYTKTSFPDNFSTNSSILEYYGSFELEEKMNASQLDGSLSNASSNKSLEVFSNGLYIYSNNGTGWWNLSINGAMRNLPPNGLYAYMTNDSSFEECFNCDNLSTIVRGVDVNGTIYVYPKNGQTASFTVPQGYYTQKVFYGDDSTNGLRDIGTTGYITTYTTNNPTLLVPADYTDSRTAETDERICDTSLDSFSIIAIGMIVLVAAALIGVLLNKGEIDLVSITGGLIVLSLMTSIGVIIISNLSTTC